MSPSGMPDEAQETVRTGPSATTGLCRAGSGHRGAVALLLLFELHAVPADQA
ncbi:hypothetical protein D3C79_1107540 [compost metagenome]